jgi:PAS domain S-box-containing protein
MMDQLTIPDKLYGRDRDMITMLESFERVSSGHGEVLLVPGSSGVGKTALVQELRMPIRDRNGFFIKGKFDQYQQNVPYFAFRQALAELCRELQSGNDRQRLRFKADILSAIGNLGQVLVDLVPEFESFFGLQPHLEDISPQEARHRFADVFRNFMKVICRPEHPLTLFIDDWQWADTASFELLKQIQVGVTLHYLLVIVSYRDNEVDFAHPLASTINDLRSHAVPVEVLQVKNITVGDVREMVTDTLRPAAEDVEGLAAIIHGKTLGNPFFVRSFLIFLHEFNLIRLDKTRNCWQWRIEKNEGAGLPGNVLDLFVLKLRSLDSDSRNLLSLAACLGNRFDLETLSIISGRDPEECLALLFSGKAKTLLLPFDGGTSNSPAEEIRVPEIYTFLHDRVQQAAYTLIEPAELPDILLKIGRMLLTSLHPEQLDERLFEVVSDLNAGFNLIADYTEQVKVVELNMTAARKAYAAAAYSSALQFYRAANRFFEKPGFAEHLWRDRHELTLRLFKKRAECEFLEGDRNEAEKCIQQSVAHAGSALEKADALNILIVQYTLLARYPEAIAAGRQALEALGIRLPENSYENARNEEIAQVRQELESRLVSSLVELPVMSHPGMLMASKILITMGPPCYRSHQRLWSVIVPKVVNLTLRYGNIPQIGYSHTAFGGLLGWVDNDYATAKEFGELATRLMTGAFRSPSDQSVFYLMIGSSIRHWFKHLRYGTQDYTDAYEIGFRSGNLQYAAYAFGHNMYCRFYQGVPLSGLIQQSQRSLEFSRTRLNQWAIDLLEGGLNIFGALSGEGSPLNGNDAWPEEEYLQRVTDHNNIQITCIYKVLKTFSFLISGNYDDALVLSDETEPLIYTVGTQGLLPWPEHVFARLLILTALYSKADEGRKNKWRPELDRMIGRLRIWADNCPENFEHKYLLAAAELARIDGRPVEAMQLYDKAVEAAQAGDFLQWEGMTNERASSFWLESGNERLAHVYWQHAYVCYDRWGAVAKVRSMETAYRMYLANNLPAGDGSGKSSEELKLEIKNVLIEKQIMQLRNYVFQMQQNRLRIEAATQAEELALATQRLRVEIVERKKAEEELSIIKTKLELALQSSKMGVWRYNIAENKRSYDNQACLLLGIDPETFSGTAEDFFVAVHPDDREKISAALKQTIEQSVPLELEYQAVWSDGSVHYIATRGKLLHDDKGNTQEINGIIWDITERKRAEEEIQRYSTELEKNNKELQKAISEVKQLSGLLPICSYCKKIRDDKGYWNQIESYIHEHSEAKFSHGICQECAKIHYPDMDLR